MDFRYTYTAKVVKVVDGDTVDLDVDLGFGMRATERFRLYGINAWERRGEDRKRGIAATIALSQMLEDARGEDFKITIETHKDKKEKYGRYLVTLCPSELGSLNQRLVDCGHAVYQEY